MENSRVSPVSFHTPLLLLAMTRSGRCAAEIRILRLPVVNDFFPIRVLALQLVFEMDLLRRDRLRAV